MGSRENSETKSKSFIHEHFLRIPVPRSIIFERSNPNPLFPSSLFSCILATNLQKRIAIPIAFLLKKTKIFRTTCQSFYDTLQYYFFAKLANRATNSRFFFHYRLVTRNRTKFILFFPEKRRNEIQVVDSSCG